MSHADATEQVFPHIDATLQESIEYLLQEALPGDAVLAIGAEAKRMVGRTPASIIAIRPLRDGVISDFDITEQMLRYFIQKVHSGMALLPRPRVIIGIPSGVTEVEKRAVQDAALSAGARWAQGELSKSNLRDSCR